MRCWCAASAWSRPGLRDGVERRIEGRRKPARTRQQVNRVRARHRITPEQPARLLRDAECPFEAEALHPEGRTRTRAGEEVEQAATGLDHPHVGQAMRETCAELLLARHAERDPQDRGRECVDLVDAPFECGGIEIAMRTPDDVEARK